jgi:hypothetical protein
LLTLKNWRGSLYKKFQERKENTVLIEDDFRMTVKQILEFFVRILPPKVGDLPQKHLEFGNSENLGWFIWQILEGKDRHLLAYLFVDRMFFGKVLNAAISGLGSISLENFAVLNKYLDYVDTHEAPQARTKILDSLGKISPK